MQLSDINARILDRLGEDPNAGLGNQFYHYQEATTWVNAVQRLFVLMTLCLETTQTLTLQANTPNYSLLNYFQDWLIPLRIRLAGGAKLKPSRLVDFEALDGAWSTTAGTPDRYALLGFDYLAIYSVPSSPTVLSITYARCPDPLVNATDVPEIPAEFHPALIDGAIPLMRAKEGGQELEKVMPMWNRFLDAAQRLGDYVRNRNREQGYDYLPVELARFDRSKLLMIPQKGTKLNGVQ